MKQLGYNDRLWPRLRHCLRDQVKDSVRQKVNMALFRTLWSGLPIHFIDSVVSDVFTSLTE